jgi:cohesin complex subunit SCC1
LPAHSHAANPAALTLPDAITDIDLLAPMPDPSLFFSQSMDGSLGLPDLDMPDWDSSQFLSTSVEQPRAEQAADYETLEDFDLRIDFGDDLDPLAAAIDEDTSIEIGRDAPVERRASEEHATTLKDLNLDDEDELNLDIDEDITELPAAPDMTIDMNDVVMGGDTEIHIPEESTVAGAPAPADRERSLSPLSELDDEEALRLEEEVQHTSIFQPAAEEAQDEEEEVQQARAKRRKVIQHDAQTQISTTEIRAQQDNRDDILKPASFIPRDPLLMALMNMQKSGGFVSSILGDGRSQGWAPELRGILSMEIVSRPAQKRKRDGSVAAVATADEQAVAGAEETLQQLELDDHIINPEDIEVVVGDDTQIQQEDQEELIHLPDEVVTIPRDEEEEEEEEEVFSPIGETFDETTYPLLHPAESGLVSLETKHAVHLLRQTFGDAGETNEEERINTRIHFQGMFPEARTTKADVSRMFNEILVLATKDAIKVQQLQEDNRLGGPIEIRAKRGLWGSWAETDVSGAEAIKAAEAAQAPAAKAASAASASALPSAEIAVEA